MVVSAGSLIGDRSPAIDRTPFSFRHGCSPKVKRPLPLPAPSARPEKDGHSMRRPYIGLKDRRRGTGTIRKWSLCAFKVLAQQLAKRMGWAMPAQDFAGPVVE